MIRSPVHIFRIHGSSSRWARPMRQGTHAENRLVIDKPVPVCPDPPQRSPHGDSRHPMQHEEVET